jgi:microcystin-dependent protein
LLVYNLGSVGLQAGYYYWNNANWATIATATSAGSGVTAMDMVKMYGEAHSSASGKMGNATTGFVFTVPVSGRYVFDFTSGATTLTGGTNTIYFQVRQGTTVLASDMQSSYNNNVHVEYNGKVEVNLQAGTTYNVYNYAASGSFETNDYDRVYYKLVAGNLPVTGQTVDYVAVQASADIASITAGTIVKFNTILGGNIPYDASTGLFTLTAGKTYRLTGVVSLAGGSLTVGPAEAVTVWRTGTAASGTNIGNYAQVLSGNSTYNSGGQGVADIIYTPTSNTTVSLYVNNITSTVGFRGGYTNAIIEQIGSSAIVNPWVLTGNDVYNNTGKVGIGNTAPTAILDVTGDAKVSGVLTAGGNAYPTTTGTSGYALTTNAAGVASWNAVPPVGVITAFAGSAAPVGYLICDGAAVSRTIYAALFAIIGTTYGTGNGSTTFNVPDLRSKTIVGVGQGTGLTNRTLASTGGAETKTLSVTEMPSHNHTINDPGHTHSQTTVNDDFNNSGGNPPGFSADGAGSRTWSNINSSTTGITINSNGSGAAFNMMNPFLSLNYIIKF